MFEDFDELYNKYFGKRYPSDRMKEIMDMMNKLNEGIEFGGLSDLENDFNNELGEPTSVDKFEENGYVFERTTWDTEHGKMMKVELLYRVGDEPKPELTLEEKLQLAIEEENYEEAAKLRDIIKGK